MGALHDERPRRRHRRRVLWLAGAVVVAVLTGGVQPVDAQARSGRTTAVSAPNGGQPPADGPVVTQLGALQLAFFPCKDRANQSYKVPPDVRSVYVEAVGGEGMTPNPHHTGWGGLGGQVTGSLSVNPGDELPVQVGCKGTSAGGESPYAPGGGRGEGKNKQTFAMSSYGVSGGGGGGASAVLSPDGKPLVVAGGGGGAGGGAPACYKLSYYTGDHEGGDGGEHGHEGEEAFWYVCHPPIYEKGGNGGDAGNPAEPGTAGENNEEHETPAGGTCEGGKRDGERGKDFDEYGGGGAGGGGGGGYKGGCGGAAGQETEIPEPPPQNLTGIGGNGGGGGLSFADSALVGKPEFDTADNSGDGYVIFLSGADSLRSFPFHFTGHPETKCIPAGTDRIFVDAVGGAGGGDGGDIGVGGGGGVVQAVVPVTPGTKVLVKVGRFGGAHGGWGDGHGGDRGVGHIDTVKDGAGGGGSSAVKATTTSCQSNEIAGEKYLVVAGGGGGGGGDSILDYDGGAGGKGGLPAGDGQNGEGAGLSTQAFGGCAGTPPGSSDPCRNSVNGGDGTNNTMGGGGGGGGGGYLGGGTGHASPDGTTDSGGGGGGGRSFAAPVDPTQVHYGMGANGAHGLDGKVTLIVPFPAKRSEVEILEGNQQSMFPGQAAQPLKVQALDPDGFPLKNVQVDFTAPAGYVVFASGPTESYSARTDDQGTITVPLKAQTPPWKTGPFQVTATVAGEQGKAIKSAKFSLANASLPTAVSLASDTPNNQANPNEPVQFTAVVKTDPPNPYQPGSTQPSPYGTPSGTVQFTVDGQNLQAPVPLDATGTAKSPVVTYLPAGVHQIEARYLGDDRQIFAPSSAGQPQAANMALVAVNVASTQPTAPIGQAVRFTAQVNGPPKLAVSPTGTVQFSVDGEDVGGPVPLSANRQATSPPISTLGVGLHTVRAFYSGDTGFLSAFDTAAQYVQGATRLTLTASNNPVLPWQTLTLRAAVTSTTPGVTQVPHGTVQFSSDGVPVGPPVPLVGGVATTPPVNLGISFFAHHVVARYSGENRFAASEDSLDVRVLSPGVAPDPDGGGPAPPLDPVAVIRLIADWVQSLIAAILSWVGLWRR